MTDLAPGATPAAPTTDAPPAAAAPTTPADYQAMYEAEAAKSKDMLNRLNLYKPAQQLLNGLDEGARAAIMELADLARAGDPDAIVEWNLTIAQQVSGKDAATIIAERQAREQGANPGAVVGEQQPGMTAEDVEQIVAQRMAAEAVRQQGIARVASEMKAAGYDHDSPVGETIIRYAVATGNDLPDAIAWYENEVQTTALARARAAAAVGQNTAQPAPQGSPSGTQPDGQQPGESPAEYSHRLALNRLTKGPTT